jgi:Domain of unknown function (DUF4266)
MVRVRLAQQLARALLMAGLGAIGAGCTHVAPYERGAIARPDMTTSELSGPAAQHVLSVHEGATRSGAVAESGCGCN